MGVLNLNLFEGLKELFEPTKGKIALTLLVSALLPVIPYEISMTCSTGYYDCGPYIDNISLLASLFVTYGKIKFYEFPIHQLLYAYLFSSIPVYLYCKIPKETKLRFKENLKISKTKLLLLAAGGFILLHFHIGQTPYYFFGRSLYILLELPALILFPFVFVVHVLRIVTTSVLHGFYGFIKLPIRPFEPWLIYLITLFEWYLFSCFLGHLLNRYRTKDKQEYSAMPPSIAYADLNKKYK